MPRYIVATVAGATWVYFGVLAAEKTVKVNAAVRKRTADELRAKLKPDTVRIHDTVKCTVFVAPRKTGPKPITAGEMERWD